MTKLTEVLKKAIIGAKGSKTTKGLADEYKVSQSTIRRVLRDAETAEEHEGQSNTVMMGQPDVKATKAQRKIEMRETIPTISLGAWNIDEPDDRASATADVENIITDDQDELDDFAEEWHDGKDEAELEAEAEAEAEEEEDIKPPTAKDQKMFAQMKEQEDFFIKSAMNPHLTNTQAQAVADSMESEASVRSKYLSRIYLNVINFHHLLPFIGNKEKFLQGLHKKTTKELISVSGLIETQRSLGNVATQMKNAFFIVSKGVEMGCSRIGMKVDGFAEDLRQKEQELNSIFQEIAVEQADNLKSYTTPQMRLAMIFTSSLMLTDSRNRALQHQRRPGARDPQAQVAPDLEAKFGDL
jgi:hypothetical protein